jgi:uncharacterized repeat protein (TIGR02543 family)
MRCKNCGAYNDDNRYICDTCGSPLYDEDEFQETPEQRTQTFTAVTDTNSKSNTAPTQPPISNDNGNVGGNNGGNKDDKSPAEKKSIIVIAILVVLLIAIIVSVIVVAQSKSKEDETSTETSISTSVTTTQHTTVLATTSTTEQTTESTTAETTTETTTTATTWYINTSSSGGGSVTGSGEYKNGDSVTITAKADSGYTFDGWYANGVKVSSSEKYSFTANENVSFSAVFYPVTTADSGNTDEDISFGD